MESSPGFLGYPFGNVPRARDSGEPARPRVVGRPDAAFRLVNGVGLATSRVFGAESSRPASLLCTLRTHQSPGEWQHSLPDCLLGSDRGRDRAEARALDQERSSHVSSGPPAIPEGRISRFRFWPWLSPVRSARDRWSLSARSHAPQPTSVYPAAVLKFMAPPIFVVGHVRTPSAQSSFA